MLYTNKALCASQGMNPFLLMEGDSARDFLKRATPIIGCGRFCQFCPFFAVIRANPEHTQHKIFSILSITLEQV